MEVEREERSPTRGLTWSRCSSVLATSAPGEFRLDSPLPQCSHFPACREDPGFVWSKIDWKGPRISVRTASPSVVCTSLQISHEFHIAGKSPKAMFSQGFAFCEEIPSDWAEELEGSWGEECPSKERSGDEVWAFSLLSLPCYWTSTLIHR